MDPVEIPDYIDSQPQLFFWELDEAIVFVFCFGVGIVIGSWGVLFGIGAGVGVVKFFRRFKNGTFDGILFHIIYWLGLASLNQRFKDGGERTYFY